MKRIFLLLILLGANIACSKIISEEYTTGDITIKVGTICGWCTLNDTLSISGNSIRYVNYTQCQSNQATIEKTGTIEKEKLQEILSAFDDDKFINLDLNTCNVCADGCDDWVYVKTTDIAHHIRFSRNDERLDEIRNFIDLLFDLKTEYAEN